MTNSKRPYYGNRRPGAACLWLIMCLMTVGSLSLINGLIDQKSLAATRDIGDIPKPVVVTGQAEPPGSTGDLTASTILPFSEPTSIEAPSVRIKSDLITVGKAADGSMEVPKAPNFDKAAWYKHSPSPGQYGASIIVGHVDSLASNGASVFFNLARLKLGETINIKRSDQTSATFSVWAIRDYGKTGLPADVIYKPTTDSAELRLITCSGKFDNASQSYENVTVIFATLTTATSP